MKLEAACGLLCCTLGSYQIIMVIIDFGDQKKGTEVQVLDAVEAFGSEMGKSSEDAMVQVLYCAADWIDWEKMKLYGLGTLHAFYLAYWIEILSGEHGRFEEDKTTYRDMSQRENKPYPNTYDVGLEPGLHRTLYYLQAQKPSERARVEEFFDFSKLTHGQAIEFRIETNEAFNYEMPATMKTEPEKFDEVHKVFEDKFGVLNSENALRMLHELSFNPLINESKPEIEIRYGQVCYKVRMRPGAKMEVTLRKQMNVRSELMPTPMKPLETVEKHTVLPAGIHLSAYLGGMVPVFGGDDDDEYRMMTSIPCFPGGFVLRRDPPPVPPRFDWNDVNPLGMNCENKCVDRTDEADSLWELILMDSEDECRRKPDCNDTLKQMEGAFGDDPAAYVGMTTKRNTRVKDSAPLGGCGSRQSFWCIYWACQQDRRVGRPPTKPSTCRRDTPDTRTGLIRSGSPSNCPNPSRYVNVRNRPISFGQRMTISVYRFHMKIYKRQSTRHFKCIDNSDTDDMLPVYQRSARYSLICRDEVFFDNCSASALLLPNAGSEQKSLPLCDIVKFWTGIERLKQPEMAKAMEECISKCGKLPPFCRTVETSLTPGAEMHRKIATDEDDLYNYHRLIITPMDIEVTSEFLVMPWDSFIANLGGLLGFFLGMSLLQWFMWPYQIYTLVKGRMQRKATEISQLKE